jgi:hypothetical protein
MASKVTKKQNSSSGNLKILGIILGVLAFIPLLGVLFGLLAIIIGLINNRHKPSIILGGLGIASTVVVYSILFIFLSKNGKFHDVQSQATLAIINTDKGQLALYYQQHGVYPRSLESAQPTSVSLFATKDSWSHDLIYKVSGDQKSYSLSSTGSDGIANNADDIVTKQ